MSSFAAVAERLLGGAVMNRERGSGFTRSD
jgi:hypothetical protein